MFREIQRNNAEFPLHMYIIKNFDKVKIFFFLIK